MITVTGVDYSYGSVPALRDLALHVPPGSVVGLIGPNGSGKSTLLRTMYHALTPAAGLVLIDGQPVPDYSPRELAQRIAVVLQEGASEVPVTVADVVLLGRVPHRASLQGYTVDDHRIAAQALRRVGARQLADRHFATLSGGEKQRVLIARCLAQGTTHVLLDEPTNHLDIRSQHEVLALVRDLGVTTVVVLHDLNLAARYCDQLVLLDRGRVVADGATLEVLTPEILEPVYGIRVRRLLDSGVPQLLFQPHPTTEEP